MAAVPQKPPRGHCGDGLAKLDSQQSLVVELRFFAVWFAKSLCPALKGFLPAWRKVFGSSVRIAGLFGETGNILSEHAGSNRVAPANSLPWPWANVEQRTQQPS